jgi:hypothetical protein
VCSYFRFEAHCVSAARAVAHAQISVRSRFAMFSVQNPSFVCSYSYVDTVVSA